MKHAFLSRRHRNPHQQDDQQKEQPFFSKTDDTESTPFFTAASHGQSVQTKLAIGQPGDKYEKEADAVADRVVSGQNQPAVQPQGIGTIQRLDLATSQEDEKLSTAEGRMEKDKSIQEKPVQRQAASAGPTPEEKKKPVQMKPAPADAMPEKKEKPVQMQAATAEAIPEKKEKPVQMQAASTGPTPEKKEKPVQMQPASTGPTPEKKEKPVQMQAASTGPTPEKKEKPVQMQAASTGPMPEKKEKPVQMQAASTGPTPEKKEKIQGKANPLSPELQREPETGGSTASPHLSSRLQDASGKGRTLPGKTRAEMESAIGRDFNGVNIHTDANAVEMNEELGAQAFTHGQDVYFNSGKYHPESADGKKLLAHELTHVVQQRGDDQVSLDRAKGASKSADSERQSGSSSIFDGSTKVRNALVAIGDFEAAARQGAYSLAELVFKLNHKKLPPSGAIIEGDGYSFQIVSTDATGLTIPKIRIIRKQR